MFLEVDFCHVLFPFVSSIFPPCPLNSILRTVVSMVQEDLGYACNDTDRADIFKGP